MRNLLKIGLVANIFEWYEFGIYAYLADVIGQLFFHGADSVGGLIKAFTVFAIGYCARPLGSLFFGLIGDRISRGYALKNVLMMSAVPTALIGLLPTYQTVGLLAPALLLALRLIQGFAMGAELPTNGCYIFEASPARYKSVLCSVVMASTKLGYLLASLIVFLLFSCFEQQTILAWAWRIPFCLSIPLIIGISSIRRAVRDLPVQQTDDARTAGTVLRALGRPMLKAFPLVAFTNVLSGALSIWLSLYLIHFLHFPPRLIWLANTLFITTSIASKLVAGYIAHSLGYQQVIKVSVVTTTLLIVPLFLWLQHAPFSVVFAIQALLGFCQGSLTGVLMETLASQFPAFARCRGMNLAYTFSVVLLGGTTPLICTWMVNKTGLLLFPAFYILFFGLLALPVALRLKGQGEQCREISAAALHR